jgi:hypothetical protein
MVLSFQKGHTMAEESIEDIKADRDLFRLALLEINTHPEEDAIGIADSALLLAERRKADREASYAKPPAGGHEEGQ